MNQQVRRFFAFTLVELMVVIAIVAVVVALMIPSLSQAKEAARRVVCSSNLRQWGISQHTYAGDNKLEFMGTHMWDLAMNYYNTQRSAQYWAENYSIYYFPRYGIKLSVRRCPSRIWPRSVGAELGVQTLTNFDRNTKVQFGPADAFYWASTDYFDLFGRGTYNSAPVNWYRWQYVSSTTLAKGWGPVPNLKCGRKTDTPVVMDRAWTSAAPNSYYNAAEFGSNHPRSGNNPGRLADGENILTLDGACKYANLKGATYGYQRDYYQWVVLPSTMVP